VRSKAHEHDVSLEETGLAKKEGSVVENTQAASAQMIKLAMLA
jgi:hypothetical protein